ncbi:O-antigen ligase family protein [Flavobacterium cellulosilyticum]|uniref:O-antigen ligase-related domain-containing protein n=1 Tax=Flavobacterium cellulosilyticum TaxID=2541731 RepID=A0A4R5CM27_9FLAO|nr:O-antigen ligase family protein [Flavobacterium cellulosilyticum]TDD98554.1 hypothetical protein E0F76_05345 [Flavobacterium cellulosilyticum]
MTTINKAIIPQQKKAGYANVVSEYIHVIALLIVIVAGLINTEYFYNPTATAYYGFCISVLFFVIVSTSLYLTKKSVVTIKAPLFSFGIWCLYILWHYFTNTGTLVFTIYSVALYFLILKATTLFSTPTFNFKLFFGSIGGIAFLESIYCITQYFGWFKSQNELFDVTGSCINPNTTAMFLALTIPVFLFLFQGKYKKLFFIGFITILIALFLLKCRAAYIGATICLIVFYGLEHNFISWLKNKKNKVAAKALFILCLLIVIPVSIHLYNSKKASSDGRKFIWKLSTEMLSQKPITGYGYGFYSKEYNLFQANYIQKGKATIGEMENAGYVITAHNELIQNAVEGGIIGLVLMLLFFGFLLCSHYDSKIDVGNEWDNSLCTDTSIQSKKTCYNLSYAGVITFLAMSMFNFSIQNVPVMCMLIVYAAIVCSTIKPLRIPAKLIFLETNKILSILSKFFTIAISVCLIYTLFGIAKADSLNKKASLLKKERQYEQALGIMTALEPHLNKNSDYWENYGNLYYLTHNYTEAIRCLNKGKELDTSPVLYLGLGNCYEKLNQYPAAIVQYEQLVNLKPSKFAFRFRLMNAYLQNKDTVNALKIAQGILALKPKIASDKVLYYKEKAKKTIAFLSIQSSK